MSRSIVKRKIVLLGSTGSIGKSTLEVVRRFPERFEVVALAAHANDALLAEQVREFSPGMVAMADEEAAVRLRAQCPGTEVLAGPNGATTLAQLPADVVLCAIVGAVGLDPLLAAIRVGNTVAVANKEPFVMAGKLVMETAKKHGAHVLPVDSEHSAIFQCLEGQRMEDVYRIHLTASGGPFYGQPRETLRAITPEQATRHPTWDMGAKISVDSATLMNKGLEIVEAMWLFGVPESHIEVVVHPQSIVHSLVEFNDGCILAHLGVTDMKFPILYALAWPERVSPPMERLDLTTMRDLTFAAPDFGEFPCLALAREAAGEGGSAPAVLNAANEEAVNAFCKRKIPFLTISDIVAEVRGVCATVQNFDLETILAADQEARVRALEAIQKVA